MKNYMIAVLSATLLTSVASAQSKINVATGSSTGTYSVMFGDLGRVCTNVSWLLEKKTSGSIENLDLLLTNKVSMAFVQLDVLKAKEQLDKDPRISQIKSLLPLSSEEVHIIAKAGSSINKFEELTPYKKNAFQGVKKRVVGAWGGSVITARVMSALSGVDYTVQSFASKDEALAALGNNSIDAVIAVVGQPAEWVSQMRGIKFLAVANPGKLANIYTPTKLYYPQVSAAPTQTVSIQSLLVTRNFKTPEKIQQLNKYKACAISKLTNLQENEGNHPKWNEVTFKTTKWPSYTGK